MKAARRLRLEKKLREIDGELLAIASTPAGQAAIRQVLRAQSAAAPEGAEGLFIRVRLLEIEREILGKRHGSHGKNIS